MKTSLPAEIETVDPGVALAVAGELEVNFFHRRFVSWNDNLSPEVKRAWRRGPLRLALDRKPNPGKPCSWALKAGVTVFEPGCLRHAIKTDPFGVPVARLQ